MSKADMAWVRKIQRKADTSLAQKSKVQAKETQKNKIEDPKETEQSTIVVDTSLENALKR